MPEVDLVAIDQQWIHDQLLHHSTLAPVARVHAFPIQRMLGDHRSDFLLL